MGASSLSAFAARPLRAQPGALLPSPGRGLPDRLRRGSGLPAYLRKYLPVGLIEPACRGFQSRQERAEVHSGHLVDDLA